MQMTTAAGMAARAQVSGPLHNRYDEVLTDAALAFLAGLHRAFQRRRVELLELREARHDGLAAGGSLDFLPETRHIREDGSWRVAEPAPGLVDRRVEITGPTEAKLAINALNCGANVWLADFEDANTPLWENMIGGQLNLIDALERRIDFTTPEGKSYALKDADELATIVVRPRGWHLPEKHITVDGEWMAGGLVDFGLYFFHCARRQLNAGKGPYFYLPKLESHLEARLWNDVFEHAQEQLGIARGTIRATVLVETYPAAFEMEEILYELREHSAGLNAGRWDYLFSVIKSFPNRREFVLPDRNSVTMTAPFMRAYTELLVHTCHRRGAHAIGGMAAFIPSKDPEVNEKTLANVREDKQREAVDGFDGSWVAHPATVGLCREEFDAVLGDRPNQLDRLREDVSVGATELLDVASTPGECTEAGLRNDVSVGLHYLASWLGGQGAVAVFDLMEDAATAEIARSQVWQWLHNDVTLADGMVVTRELVDRIVDEELAKIREEAGEAFDAERYSQARSLFTEVALADELVEFFTLSAYERMP
jgi:malate synthase